MGFYQQGRNDGRRLRPRHRNGASPHSGGPRILFPQGGGAGQREAAARNIASAIWSWPRVCLSSCGAASRTTNCSTWPRRTSCMSPPCSSAGQAHAGRSQAPKPLVINFAGQWLSLRALQTQVPVTAEFPDFDDNLRQAMRKETEMFVDSIVHEDRPVTDLLDANYTFLNERLAKHYGIPERLRQRLPPRRAGAGIRHAPRPAGQGLSRNDLVASPAGTSAGAARQDGDAGVPRRGAAASAARTCRSCQTESRRRSRRTSSPPCASRWKCTAQIEPCASCHKIMDPIGFSLENFDAVGHWRTTDDGSPINAAGVLVDGTKLDGVEGLRAALVRYSPQFVRVITEKLMIYALGRGTEYFDMPLVRSIVHDAREEQLPVFVVGAGRGEERAVPDEQQSCRSARNGQAKPNQERAAGTGSRRKHYRIRNRRAENHVHHQKAHPPAGISAWSRRDAGVAVAGFHGSGADAAGENGGRPEDPFHRHLRPARHGAGILDPGQAGARSRQASHSS